MKVKDYLEEKGVGFQTHEHEAAYTAQEFAAREHVSGKMVAKSVVVCGNGNFALCVLSANRNLDMEKVARVMKATMVRLADEVEMAKLFPDAEVGAEPPFGNLYALPTFVDTQLAHDKEIVFEAGTHHQAARMKYEDYSRLVKPTVCDLATML